MALVRASGYALPLVGALYWKYKTQSYFDLRARGWPVCPVRYEGLVSSPEPQLRQVLRFLGLPWGDAGVLRHAEFGHPEVFPSGRTVGDTDPRRPIDADSVDRWQRFVTPAEAAGLLTVAGDLNDRIRRERNPGGLEQLARRRWRALAW